MDRQTNRHTGRLQRNINVVYGILLLSIIAKIFRGETFVVRVINATHIEAT